MKKAVITRKGLELAMRGPRGIERLGIRSKHPATAEARALFEGLGVMQLVAPYLPRIIETDFSIHPKLADIIGDMYLSEVAWKPRLIVPAWRSEERKGLPLRYTGVSKRVAVAYSAGKDSLWNMAWAREEYGPENVLCVHISGLNRSNATWERAYTLRQAKALGFKHLTIIDLLNSSRNTGYAVMRSRDMFLMGVIAPFALEFGASEIITEGFAESVPSEPFTGQELAMQYFNCQLERMNIPLAVAWRNCPEIQVVRDLIECKPGWLRHVCNCFSALCYKPGLRRAWARNAPSFPLYDSQCGSCVKCRIINLARVCYDPAMRRVRKSDIRYFLKNTAQWIKTRGKSHADMITASFMSDFEYAAQQYGVAAE